VDKIRPAEDMQVNQRKGGQTNNHKDETSLHDLKDFAADHCLCSESRPTNRLKYTAWAQYRNFQCYNSGTYFNHRTV